MQKVKIIMSVFSENGDVIECKASDEMTKTEALENIEHIEDSFKESGFKYSLTLRRVKPLTVQ